MGVTRWMDLLDAIYDLESAEESWLGRVADAAQRVFPSAQGVAAYTFSFQGTPGIGPVTGLAPIAALPLMVHDEMPAEAVRAAYCDFGPRALPVSWAWATPQGPQLPPRYGRAIADLDLTDGYAVLAPVGPRGVAIGLGMPRVRARQGSLSLAALNVRWSAIARHTSTALRLRAALVEDTLLDLGRRRGGALGTRVASAREDVSPELGGLESWAGLLAGRWSIVRAQHGGGRQRWLAVENPAGDPLRGLTPAERELVERARTGDALKAIAIDLCLDEATVATTLARGLRKLGLASRAELITVSAGLRAPR